MDLISMDADLTKNHTIMWMTEGSNYVISKGIGVSLEC